MEPGRPVSLPQRIWTVDIRTRFGSSAAVCDTCGPLQHSPDRALRTAVLRHLARHAHRDVTPQHLRTCQCGRRGCPWHRRHRGCTGVILLAVTCEEASRSWRLADVCRQCVTATAHTAPVPGLADPASSTPGAAVHLGEEEEDEQPQVWAPGCPACGTPGASCRFTGICTL